MGDVTPNHPDFAQSARHGQSNHGAIAGKTTLTTGVGKTVMPLQNFFLGWKGSTLTFLRGTEVAIEDELYDLLQSIKAPI